MAAMRRGRRLLPLTFAISIIGALLLPISPTFALDFNSAPARFWGRTVASDLKSEPLLATNRAAKLAGEPKSEWKVTYSGFPDEAKAAVQRAIDIWSFNFASKTPINVAATWENNSDGDVLGTARPGFYFNSFPGSPDDTLWYPSALANALAGRDLNPSQDEIMLRINSSPNQLWYTGTDGKPDPDSYDLVSVVIHEIGHGLGFLSNAEYDQFFGTGYMFQPTPYDAYVQLPDGRRFTDFCSRSVELGKAMLGPLYWSGSFGIAANSGVKPKLFTPGKYQDGSSITHLDESMFSKNKGDSVMTPKISPGETFDSPGSLALAMIDDMLTKPPAGMASGIPAKPVNVKALVGDGYALLTFENPNCSRVDRVTGYQVTISPGNESRTYKSGPIKITGLKNGKSYAFKIAAQNEKGISEPVTSNNVKPQATSNLSLIDPYSKVTNMSSTTYRGKPTIFYGDRNTQSLKSATYQFGKWQIRTVRKNIDVGPLSICKSGVGSKEAIHLFYSELQRKDLLYSRLQGGKWSNEVVDGNGPDVQDYRESARRTTASDVSVSSACAYTKSGLQVFYRDESQGILLGAVKTKNGWVYEVVDGDSKENGRTTGDVGFSISATAMGDSVYLLYDSVLTLSSNRSVNQGEVRLAVRKSIFPEDWNYQTLDGPDSGNSVAGYSTAIFSDKTKVVAMWLSAQGDTLPNPARINYLNLTTETMPITLSTSSVGTPSRPTAIDGDVVIFGCSNRLCYANLKDSKVKLANGSMQTSDGARIIRLKGKNYLVAAYNQRLSISRL